jgi:putative phosphoesterase
MRIAIVSDIHANIEALSSMPDDYDELWVLGDLVGYGPSPREVIDFVRSRAAVVVRGNHDHAAAFDSSPGSPLEFREMAEATLAYTRAILRPEDLEYLGKLPLMAEKVIDGTRFLLCHETLLPLLHAHLPAHSEHWITELERIADVFLVGHTHKLFIRRFCNVVLVSPGSLGQPKRGRADACYAIWDGDIELRSFEYPVARTIAQIERMPIRRRVRADLISVLQSGGAVLV